MTQQHPTVPLALFAAESVLLEQAAGRPVDPARLAWARELIALNPQKVPAAAPAVPHPLTLERPSR